MQLPDDITEEAFLTAVEKVVEGLASPMKSRFAGFMSPEDVEQTIRLFCVIAVRAGQYDSSRSLASYLHRCAKNRLLNLLRDRVSRWDSPCRSCQRGMPCQPGGQCCRAYAEWKRRNDAKRSLANLQSLDLARDREEPGTREEPSAASEAVGRELEQLIDRELSPGLRGDYMRMRDGGRVPRNRRLAVQDAVRDILEQAGVDVSA